MSHEVIVIRCEHCGHEHGVPEDHIPVFGARIRCAGCGQLVDLPPRHEAAAHHAEPDRVSGARGPTVELAGDTAGNPGDARAGEPTLDPAGDAARAMGPSPHANGARPAGVSREDVTQIAEALIRDIAFADDARLRRARAARRVLAEYAGEIADAFDRFRERVGNGDASAFRTAVRHILAGEPAEGQADERSVPPQPHH